MTAPKRRWLSWSLRSFPLIATLAAGWFGWQAYQVHLRTVAIAEIESKDGYLTEPMAGFEVGLPWMWKVLGAKEYQTIQLPGDTFSDADCERFRDIFPEIRPIWVLRHANMTAAQFKELREMPPIEDH